MRGAERAAGAQVEVVVSQLCKEARHRSGLVGFLGPALDFDVGGHDGFWLAAQLYGMIRGVCNTFMIYVRCRSLGHFNDHMHCLRGMQ